MLTTWRDVAVAWDDRSLEIGNSRFRRTFNLAGGVLRTLEMRSADGVVYAAANRRCCDLECYGCRLDLDRLGCSLDALNCQVVEDDPFEAPHLLVTVRIFEPFSRSRLTREFRLFPERPFYSIRNGIESRVLPNHFWLHRRRLEADYGDIFRELRDVNEPLMDVVHPAEGFRITRTVEFFGHTDVHDHPVVEHPCGDGRTGFTGNLLYCEDACGRGFLLLQEAPPSSERREREECDFRLSDKGDIHSLCWGVMPEDLGTGRMLHSYRGLVALYGDAEERERVLKDYLALRVARSAPRHAVVANAWGCGSFPERLSGAFLKDEIAAAAECGAECYQIDDGWQTGGSLGFLTLQNRCCPLRDFWSVDPGSVGSGGFEELAETARRHRIGLALWLAPSTNLAYRDHTEFKDLILDLHRRYGFDLFKLDNAGFPTHESERNFTAMVREARLESGKRIYFNLDVTAGQRGGYFLLGEYGTIFLENRYVCRRSGQGYHPEHTLRNLWNLSRYVRTQTLQIEIASPWDIDPEFYRARNLVPPDSYPWTYWMAVAFFANPLLWFAPSSVPSRRRLEIRAMMELHRRCRARIFAGAIHPLGTEPDGRALTGFVSRDQAGRNRFAILFRELDADQDTLNLPGSWTLLAGDGHADGERLAVHGKAAFAIFCNPEECPGPEEGI